LLPKVPPSAPVLAVDGKENGAADVNPANSFIVSTNTPICGGAGKNCASSIVITSVRAFVNTPE